MTTISVHTFARHRRLSVLTVVSLFGLACAWLMVIGRSSELRYVFPLGAIVLAAWIQQSRGFPSYAAFTWIMWLLVPGIRRLVDFRNGGWDATNPIALTPLLVSGLALFTVLHRLPEIRRRRLVMWGCAIACVILAFFSGLLQNGLMAATHSLITWLAPLCFGLAIALEWRRYPECSAQLTRVFLWLMPLIAGYGILQFLSPPAWDVMWVNGSGMLSVGLAEPLKLRSFGLLNSPLALATILMAGLFLVISSTRGFRWLLAPLVVSALLLTQVRSVWLVTVAGVIVYLLSLPLRAMRRGLLMLTGAVAMLGALPLALSPDMRADVVRVVQQRMQTLSDISGDLSFEERISFSSGVGQVILDHPLGQGLGSTGVSSTLILPVSGIRDFDNGVLAVIYSLGWVGGFLFLGAVLTILLQGMPRTEGRDDGLAKSARAILVACLLLALGSNVFEGLSAAVLWTFAGLLTAAQLWQQTATRPAASRGRP